MSNQNYNIQLKSKFNVHKKANKFILLHVVNRPQLPQNYYKFCGVGQQLAQPGNKPSNTPWPSHLVVGEVGLGASFEAGSFEGSLGKRMRTLKDSELKLGLNWEVQTLPV